MKWRRALAVLGGVAVCGGLFVILVLKGKAIAPRGQPPFFLLLLELALFMVGLLIAAVSDVKSREIPNAAPLLLFAAGVLKLALVPSVPSVVSALLGAFLGGSPLLILALFSHSIGGGDVKLAASAGLALGWLGSYLALLIGLVGFVLYGGVKCIRSRRTNQKVLSFPFAPAYAVGCVAVIILSCVLRHSIIV
ncbi:MAG: A24 family peptidase [Ethanoligenens sp.]